MTDADLAKVEAEIGFALPDQYRRFLLANSGGRIRPDTFHFANGEPGSTLSRFLKVGAGEDDPMNDLVIMARSWRDELPDDLVPIARDKGGNFVCIGVRGARLGKIHFWGRDGMPLPKDSTREGNIVAVADSFDEFLADLHDA